MTAPQGRFLILLGAVCALLIALLAMSRASWATLDDGVPAPEMPEPVDEQRTERTERPAVPAWLQVATGFLQQVGPAAASLRKLFMRWMTSRVTQN